MELNKLNVKFITLAKTRKTHAHYARVVELADEYSAHITGEGIDKYLNRFTPRESTEMFAQRVQLTNSISPAIASSLMKPFAKVARNNAITKKIDFRNPAMNEKVATMLEDFNGEKVDDTDGFENWLKSRFLELTFSDPNAFIVLEWDNVGAKQLIKPRPFEVSSAEALNFKYKGQELEWLFVEQKITVNKKDGDKTIAGEGFRFTMYATGKTLVLQEIDRDFYLENYKLNPEEEIIDLENKVYLFAEYNTALTFVPAFRVGYIRDLYTKGRTFVNPFHSAMTYFRKALKTVSELDITMTAHVFPQKLQYMQKCQGASVTEPCSDGRDKSGRACRACNGTGFKTVTTAQEVLMVPMPEMKDEFFPLDQMLVYKSPPIELVRFQDEYVRNLKQDAHLSVYNSNMLLATDAQFAKTATEIDSNMEGVYDTIEPFTERYSKVFKFVVYTSAALAGFNQQTADFDLIHVFPSDPKLKTVGILFGELKAANESGAPAFVRQILTSDIAEIVFNGDPAALQRFKVRNMFAPYNGKSESEIALALASQYTSELTKILHVNFDAIFTEIERTNAEFYAMPYLQQVKIVDDMVLKYKNEILTELPARLTFAPDAAGNAPKNAGSEANGTTASEEEENAENGFLV